MKRLLIALALLCLIALPVSARAAGGEELTILFTHDTHSHFLPTPAEDGGESGGYTRLYTLLQQQRADADGPVITLDGGDFSMGTLFQTIFATDAAELRMLGAMGYDVVTFGNHEYDYRAQGLADMLSAAAESGDTLPAIVQANYRPITEDNAPDGVPSQQTLADSQAVLEAFEQCGVSDYTVVERQGLRIAVFGLLGQDADECSPMSGMAFEPIADAAQRVVDEIRETADADFIICLSHCGTDPDPDRSEDQLLAQEVSGIDVIISGHTHSTLAQPIIENDTIIVSAGEYTQNLGKLTIVRDPETGAAAVSDYELIPVDETVEEDPAMLRLTEGYKQTVQSRYLSAYDMSFDQVLAQSPFSFTPIGQLGAVQQEDSLGNLIADSYVYAVQEAEGEQYIPVDFAVVAAGVIRGSFAQGPVTVSDAFNVSSLGSGADGTPGYPLISVYITGSELRDAFEVDASVTPLMPAAQLYGSGMHWEYNTRRMIFNKVTEAWQVLPDGSRAEIEDDRLYRVVTGLYSGQMLGTVNSKSFGILTVTPRHADGTPVSDFEDCIIYTSGGAEVKEWYALASYLQSLGTIPDRYEQPEGRKVVFSSLSPYDLLKNPNWVTLAALGLAVLFVAAVTIIAIFVRRRKKRKAAKAAGHTLS